MIIFSTALFSILVALFLIYPFFQPNFLEKNNLISETTESKKENRLKLILADAEADYISGKISESELLTLKKEI
jgi:hypothetical protein